MCRTFVSEIIISEGCDTVHEFFKSLTPSENKAIFCQKKIPLFVTENIKNKFKEIKNAHQNRKGS
jgi:hypothetical protein